jgi:hypothetical protein
MIPFVKQPHMAGRTPFVHWYNVAVLHAGVAELVDAPDSKFGEGNLVWVRVPPPALLTKLPLLWGFRPRNQVPPMVSALASR